MGLVDAGTLTAGETMLVERARRFATDVIGPAAAGWDRAGMAVPRAVFLRYGAEGFSGLMVPKELGGQGAGFICKIRVAEAMARACFAAAFALNNTQGVALRLAEAGTEVQRARWLPRLLRGEAVCAPAVTEPGAGSDATALATLARRVDGGWRLSGEKAWVTNGSHADLLVVYAQTSMGSGAKGIGGFLVEMASEGVRRGAAYAVPGGAACGLAGVTMEEVFVPDAAVIAAPGMGFRAAMAGIVAARVHVAAMVNGVVADSLERAVAHAGRRVAFGRTLLEHQGLRWSLADVATGLEASRLMTDRAAALVAAGRDAVLEASQAKLFATDLAGPAVAACAQAMGADGLVESQPFARHAAGVRMAAYADGTSEMLRDRIGALLAPRGPA